MQETITIILYSYLLGSVPFGFILYKIFKKKDIRESGSGNIGATNVIRSGNKVLGVFTLILDCAKGFLAVVITKQYYLDYFTLSAFFVFIGHLFPFWLKFKGGKGVATYLGVLFAVSYLLPLIFIVTWLIIIYVSRYVSLASIISSLVVLISNLILNIIDQSIILFLFWILIVYSHRSNILRLNAGHENKINL